MFKCGEKWGEDHTFLTTLQLHIVKELLELIGSNALRILEENY